MDREEGPYAQALSKDARLRLLELLERKIAEESDRNIKAAREQGDKVPRRRVYSEVAMKLNVTHVSVLQMLGRKYAPSDRLTEAIIREVYKRDSVEARRLILGDLKDQQKRVKQALARLEKMKRDEGNMMQEQKDVASTGVIT